MLTFVTEVIRLHRAEQRVPGVAQLIAASITERERWIPIIREVLGIEDGTLIDSTQLGAGTQCGRLRDEAPLVWDLAEEMLASYNAMNPDADLRLNEVDERIEVIGDMNYESANAAQRAFREIVTAICSDALRSSQLVGLMFAQDALDGELLALVWQALMELPTRLPTSSGTTIVVLAGDGYVNFDVHCTGDPSLRFRINERGLHVRHPFFRSVEPITTLGRQALDDVPIVVLFLGAGASTWSGLPVGDQLRDQALSHLTQRAVDHGTFNDVASDWFDDLKRNGALAHAEVAGGVDAFVKGLTLERVLQKEQADEKQTFTATLRRFDAEHTAAMARIQAALNPATDSLARIASKRSRLVLVTVNFDHTIETRCGANVRPFVTESDMASFPAYLTSYIANGGEVPLLKLHGDIGVPTTLVANLEQTSAGLSLARDKALSSLVDRVENAPTHYWWYIGYSMRDRDLEQAWTAPRMATFNEEWVAPFLDPVVEEFITVRRSRRWQESGQRDSAQDRLISLTAESFFEEFASRVSDKW